MSYVKTNKLIQENNVIYKTSHRKNKICPQDAHVHCCLQNEKNYTCWGSPHLQEFSCNTTDGNYAYRRIRFIKIRCLSKSSKEE